MIYTTVTLPPYEEATLTAICVSNTAELKQTPRKAVIVCPGGGYHFLSDREAEPIATQFLAAGFATFILRYTVAPKAADYAPLCQVALAVRYVREHAADFNVNPDYIFTCGFSAGGHLAASAGVLWEHPRVQALMSDATPDICRPTGMILSYPVITGGEYGHFGSFQNLCGKKEPSKEELDALSLEKHVSAATPPAFIWHTFPDTCVPVQNALMFAEAMTAAGVPFELHIFPTGAHGLSLCNEQVNSNNPHNEVWMPLAIRWAKDLKV